MKCYHGTVLTVNAHNDVASYLVENGGKIVFVGNELPEKYGSAWVYTRYLVSLSEKIDYTAPVTLRCRVD